MLQGCGKDDEAAFEAGDEFDQYVAENSQHEKALLVAAGRMAPYPAQGMENADNATLGASWCAFGHIGNTCGMCTQELARCCGACGEDGAFAEQESSCNYECPWGSDKFKAADYCASCEFAWCWITQLHKSTENACNGVAREIGCLADGSGESKEESWFCKVVR